MISALVSASIDGGYLGQPAAGQGALATAWASVEICRTNSNIADALARDQRTSVLANGVHLRLDDGWQADGIWRAERVDDRWRRRGG